jgi:Tol biopolymer transport system component
MNCAVVPLACRCSAVQVFSTWKNASVPILSRSACRVIAPRTTRRPTAFSDLRENPRLHAAALFVVNVNGSGLRQITAWQPGELPTASWSPDGQWILTDNAQGGLYVVHPDGTGLHQIPVRTGSRARAFAFQPGWSPDGRKIVFSLFTGRGPGTGQEDIYTANADGTEVTHVTTTPDFEEGAEWGPYTG